MNEPESSMSRAAAIIRDAGGRVVGRTRLQKVAYLLELANAGEGYNFHYRYYGPYSEELSDDLRSAWAYNLIDEEEKTANWGGTYSIFTLADGSREADPNRAEFAQLAAETDAVVLELAATAAYLKAEEGCDDPWEEVRSCKPGKATKKRLEEARHAYNSLRKTKIGSRLPAL